MPPPAPLDLVFPRPASVTLAGEPHQAGELTLGDLATLQSWLRAAAPHPLAGLPPAWSDPEPGTRRRRLVAAWHAAKAWPPALGSEADAAHLDSPEGRAVFLVVCLGKHDPEFRAEQATDLASRMDADDWRRLRRVAWAIPPWKELALELDPAYLEARIREKAETDWAAVVVAAMKACPGLDFATIAGWTPTQLALFCGDGTLPGYRAAMRPGESREQFAARMVATFGADGPVSPDD